MSMKEIMDTIKTLGKTNGFYGRLYTFFANTKRSDPFKYEEMAVALESENFADAVDVVMFFEA